MVSTASVVAVMVQSFSTSTAFTGGGGGGGLGVELVAVSVCLLGQFLGLLYGTVVSTASASSF